MRRLRDSFATRLLVGSLAIILAVLVGISTFLIVSRERATRDTAIGNAENRAAVARNLLVSVTKTTGQTTVRSIATQAPLATALGGSDAATVVPELFRAGSFTAPKHLLAVLDANGTALFSTLQSLPAPTLQTPSVAAAQRARSTPVSDVEVVGVLTVDSAQAVVDASGKVVGTVIDVAPLLDQILEFGPVIGPDYEPVVIPAAGGGKVLRVGATSAQAAAPADPPPSIAAAAARGDAAVSDTYDAPLLSGGSGQVAGAYQRLTDATGATSAYIGVEVPLSVFTGSTSDDEKALITISIFVILCVCILVGLFVHYFVRRPVHRLERGVARIAGGDYTTDIPVTSADELGRLAASVNRMRAEIAANTAKIEEQRAFLDQAVERLGGVSRALTTTTEGVGALQKAVVRAATSLTGTKTAAVIFAREENRFVAAATVGVAGSPSLADWGVVDELLAGRGVRVQQPPSGWQAGGLLALPMFYQEQVTGALAIFTAPGVEPRETELSALSILANNAAIALENTRLFEQEKQTVQRLRELDAMKSDFLATVQHELRTPLTAIMGMSDLLEMCWSVWEDKEKLDAVSDIQLASKNLYEIVETIIDFSLLERDTLGLRPALTPVADAVDEALRDLTARTKDGLPVEVRVEIDPNDHVWADRDRFGQVLRALLDNAIKFSPAGSTVHVRSSSQEAMLRLDIVDEGVGIPTDAIERIFDRFYQVDNSATRQFGGTGMGLALVRRLVDAHGARIEVESVVGRGSMFTLAWPASEDAAGGELAPAARNGHHRETTAVTADGGGPNGATLDGHREAAGAPAAEGADSGA
jgi:signal transduction histidine kinase